jgi:hypothetical protein
MADQVAVLARAKHDDELAKRETIDAVLAEQAERTAKVG